MRIAAKEVKVTIGSDPGKSSGSPSFGTMKMRAANAGNLEIKSLLNSSQNEDLYIKTISYLVDGTKIAEIGLTPGSAKNPYVAIKVSGSGGQAEMQVRASNGLSNSASASVN